MGAESEYFSRPVGNAALGVPRRTNACRQNNKTSAKCRENTKKEL